MNWISFGNGGRVVGPGLRVAAAAVIATSLMASAATASPAYSFASAPSFVDSQLSLGFEFTTTEAISVTALGYWDFGGDGFATDHGVGIFDSSQSLVASGNLSAGTGNPLIDQFRYISITPVTLGANQTFRISATTYGASDAWATGNAYGPGTGPFLAAFNAFSVLPGITIAPNAAMYVYQSDNILRYPTQHFADYTVYAGPNFLTVPEPSTMTLIGMALLSMFGFGLMRRRAGA